MRLTAVVLLSLVVVAGCAQKQYHWEKSGSTPDEFHRDRGQCMQATFSTPLATTMQQQAIFASCMQGKGWYSVESKR